MPPCQSHTHIQHPHCPKLDCGEISNLSLYPQSTRKQRFTCWLWSDLADGLLKGSTYIFKQTSDILSQNAASENIQGFSCCCCNFVVYWCIYAVQPPGFSPVQCIAFYNLWFFHECKIYFTFMRFQQCSENQFSQQHSHHSPFSPGSTWVLNSVWCLWCSLGQVTLKLINHFYLNDCSHSPPIDTEQNNFMLLHWDQRACWEIIYWSR